MGSSLPLPLPPLPSPLSLPPGFFPLTQGRIMSDNNLKCEECQKIVGSKRFCTNCGKPNAAYSKSSELEGPGTKVVFDRTLYPMCLLSCIACRPLHLTITTRQIDTSAGCCYGKLDTMDIRRIRNISFHRNCFQMCINRGTIKIEAADETDSVLKMSFFGAKKVFKELRVLWNQVKMGTVVE